MKKEGESTAKVNAAATVVTASLGRVKYTWTGTDTDTAGTYIGQFEMTSGGKKRTAPNRRENRLYIVIEPDNG